MGTTLGVFSLQYHAIDLNCPQFRSGLFSAKGTFLCQPRVQRRESANAAKPWEEDQKELKAPTPKSTLRATPLGF